MEGLEVVNHCFVGIFGPIEALDELGHYIAEPEGYFGAGWTVSITDGEEVECLFLLKVWD